ncbi:Na+/H+ antiporter NhaC family protein [Agromyces sp. NBRC 114283]|uniref:Na+/H+ antiporter NhaC family protein n=1 Tax=Agromyces sp. NBRC 114283 TaxID=2994521 RepID=UPI0024A37DA0|nr:Na+/H+ antiporter NhaC family protein [Agromyces sp. NBRC 114283]GLU89625.1 sodium:proton antiporter [Agromyces sp. NBRC 114283]
MQDVGALALLPVVTILVIAVATRRTLFAMICGTLVGAVLLGGWEFFDSWIGYFGTAMADETLQWLMLVVVLFGILITLFERSGAVSEFAAWAERFVNSRRKSLVLSFLLAVVLFVDDYLSVLTVGTSMKGITDRYRVPRTQLGTIMKLTAAPVAVIVPFSTWALFFAGLLEAQGVTANGSGFGAYLQAIPFIFFGWIALAIAALVALGWFPKLGVLKKDVARAEATGDVFPLGTTEEERAAEGAASVDVEVGEFAAQGDAGERAAVAAPVAVATRAPGIAKPRPWNFVVPIAVMIAVTILTEVDVLKGTVAALLVAIIMYTAQRRLGIRKVFDAAFDGVGSMLFVIVLTALAFMVQHMNIELKLADFVIDSTEPYMSGALLPAVVFLVCGVYAYATGSFWDLAAVITPIVIPLAFAMEVNPIIAGAAVFSGAALGSTTCLYGDGIILASRSTGIKPLNLMTAILPYAAIAAAISLVLYLVVGFAGI